MMKLKTDSVFTSNLVSNIDATTVLMTTSKLVSPKLVSQYKTKIINLSQVIDDGFSVVNIEN